MNQTRWSLGGYGLAIGGATAVRGTFDRMVAVARQAEDVGFEAVWTNELYSHSAPIRLAALAQSTARCALGSAIAYGVGRSPMVLAAEARDLDVLCGGRIVLGLGNGTPRMMEDWHGVSGDAPAVRMEELVELLRRLWRLHEGPVEHEGRFYRVVIRPDSRVAPPLRVDLPILIAGINPRMVEAAGRVADGLIGHPMFTARYREEVVRPALRRGAERRDRDPQGICLVGEVLCSLDEDEEAARRHLAYGIATYAASRVYSRLFELHGWAAERTAIEVAARAGDRHAMVEAVTDDMIDEIGIACRPRDLARAAARHATGVDHLILAASPWGLTSAETDDAGRAIVAAMGEALTRQSRPEQTAVGSYR